MATVFACSRCGEEFQSASTRSSHSRSVHRTTYQLQLNDGTIKIIEKGEDGRFHCPVVTCSSSYPRSDGLRLHYTRKHSETVGDDPFMDQDVHAEDPIINQGPTTIPDHDLSSTPELLSNAKLCIVHHNSLVLLVCLQCHTALQHTEGTSIIRHVGSHQTRNMGRVRFAT